MKKLPQDFALNKKAVEVNLFLNFLKVDQESIFYILRGLICKVRLSWFQFTWFFAIIAMVSSIGF